MIEKRRSNSRCQQNLTLSKLPEIRAKKLVPQGRGLAVHFVLLSRAEITYGAAPWTLLP